MQIFKEFLLGFWIWWYFERQFDLLKSISLLLNGLARRSRLDVSIRYLFVPLYQSRSAASLIFSLPVRLIMLLSGGVIQIFGMAAALVVWVGYMLLPLSPVIILLLWATS